MKIQLDDIMVGIKRQYVRQEVGEKLGRLFLNIKYCANKLMGESYQCISTGTRTDVHRLREATRKVGAYLVVDVTQAAGAMPIDAKGWEADILVCSGYKWLGGQGGVGLAVVSPALLKQTPPAPGWMGAPDPFGMQATKLLLADDARRFTQSTMSYIVHGWPHCCPWRIVDHGHREYRSPCTIIGKVIG